MKAVVNDQCAGSGMCTETCPAVFEIGEDQLAKVKVDVVPEDAEEVCRQAATECPLQAIEIEE